MNLDLDAIKAVLQDRIFLVNTWNELSVGHTLTVRTARLMAEVLNAALGLIAEVERLRTELADAKRIGAAEWHEAEAALMVEKWGINTSAERQHLKIAAELRAGGGKV